MTKHETDFHLHCAHPWFGISFSYNGNVALDCCDYSFSGMTWDHAQPLDIRGYWNHPWFQKLRTVFRGESLSGTGCEWCRNGDSLFEPHEPETPEDMNHLQQENFIRAVESYRDREIKVEHFPVKYHFDFGRQCNLDCIMCSQADVRKTVTGGQLSSDALMAQVEVLQYGTSAQFFGGEPLAIPESRKMIRNMLRHPKLLDMELRLVTNGVLLNDFLDEFLNKEHLLVAVSLDSWGDSYEKIRHGSSWERVSSNVDRFLELRTRYEKKHWHFIASAILMKTSIMRLPEFFSWCLERDIPLTLYPLISTRHTENEDVVKHPELLDEVPDWEGKIDQVSCMLRDRGHDTMADWLDGYKATLQDALARRDIEGAIDADLSLTQRLETCDMKGKNVVVWGTGSNYRYSVAPWLQANKYKFQFLGFVDNNPDMQGRELDGSFVHPPSILKDASTVDVVVVASVYRTQIINQIVSMEAKVGKII